MTKTEFLHLYGLSSHDLKIAVSAMQMLASIYEKFGTEATNDTEGIIFFGAAKIANDAIEVLKAGAHAKKMRARHD